MKHQRSPKNRSQSLDQRLAADPALLDRLHQIADMREQLLSQGCSLDEIESRVIEQMRLLGRELLSGTSQLKANEATARAMPTGISPSEENISITSKQRKSHRATDQVGAFACFLFRNWTRI